MYFLSWAAPPVLGLSANSDVEAHINTLTRWHLPLRGGKKKQKNSRATHREFDVAELYALSLQKYALNEKRCSPYWRHTPLHPSGETAFII